MVDDSGPDVFEYSDYHEFLRDWVERERVRRPSFSYQWLANRAGIKSRSFLRLVCVGEKDLSKASALRIAQAMGLEGPRAEFFLVLVDLNNADDTREKALHLERLGRIAPPSRRTTLSVQQYELFETWWMIPLWEILCACDWKDDWARVASRLEPPISVADVRHGVELLLGLELLEKTGDGRYVRRETSLHTQDEVRSKAVRRYQETMLERAREALLRIPQDERHISTLTMGVDEAGYRRIQERIRAFRSEIVDIAQAQSGVDRVIQINLQVFPLSKVPLDPLEQGGSSVDFQ
jgi:uncharacterized protein (TIGR02147 family)